MSEIIIKPVEYYQMLLNAIPELHKLKNKAGGEGVVYFLNDKFVVKKYFYSGSWESFDRVFDVYCTEMQRYGEEGYSVPKIYSWVKVPNAKYDGRKNNNKYDYYVLEECVQGREMYYGFLEDFYPACQDRFKSKEYFDVLHDPEVNLVLFDEIIKAYIGDYIQMNEMIESMPEQVLTKFIFDCYQIHKNAEHSEIDLFPSNIIIQPSKFTLIDNHISVFERRDFDDDARKNDEFIARFLNLFCANEMISDLNSSILFRLNGAYFDKDYSEYQMKNAKACKAAAIKMIDVMNKSLDNPMFSNDELFGMVFASIKRVLERDDAVEVMKRINTGFIPTFS